MPAQDASDEVDAAADGNSDQPLYTHTGAAQAPVRSAPAERALSDGPDSMEVDPFAGGPLDREGEPELAAPQVPLSVELPTRPPPAGNSHRPPVEPVRPERARAAVARYTDRDSSFSRSVRSLEPIWDLEAAAFAGRFAADFQSFDEDQPTRRAEVLRPLLADPQACTWGWSGAGRQRADAPQPNRIYRRSDLVVFVEVLVRVTPYARACHLSDEPGPAPVETPDPPGLLGPSSVPPVADPRWVAGGASWVRMTVPITRSAADGRLVVDPHLVPESSA